MITVAFASAVPTKGGGICLVIVTLHVPFRALGRRRAWRRFCCSHLVFFLFFFVANYADASLAHYHSNTRCNLSRCGIAISQWADRFWIVVILRQCRDLRLVPSARTGRVPEWLRTSHLYIVARGWGEQLHHIPHMSVTYFAIL